MCGFGETGVRHARTKRRDRDAVALEFAMKGFSQAQDVGFGGGIDGEVLHALVGQHTGDEQNFAALPRPHVLRKNMGDGGQARDVQLHHRQHPIERSIRKRAL